MNAQQQNDELRQRTEQALLEAFPHICADSFALLCWHCGINPQILVNHQPKEKEYA